MPYNVLSTKTLHVIIDAGHGFFTPGKRPFDDSMREAHFNYDVATKLSGKLSAYENVKVHFVYDLSGKTDTPLAIRTARANAIMKKYPGDKYLYISIHANAYGTDWNRARGFESYIHPRAGKATDEARKAIHYAVLKATGQTNRGEKKADFHVLRETLMEAVLLEAAFMSNKDDLKLLKSAEYREKYTQGIINGLVTHYGLKTKPQEKPKPIVRKAEPEGNYRVQVFYGSYEGAKQLENQLHKAGFPATVLKA